MPTGSRAARSRRGARRSPRGPASTTCCCTPSSASGPSAGSPSSRPIRRSPRGAPRALLGATLAVARLTGANIPAPRHVPLEQAATVATWLHGHTSAGRRPYLNTTASGAVRVVRGGQGARPRHRRHGVPHRRGALHPGARPRRQGGRRHRPPVPPGERDRPDRRDLREPLGTGRDPLPVRQARRPAQGRQGAHTKDRGNARPHHALVQDAQAAPERRERRHRGRRARAVRLPARRPRPDHAPPHDPLVGEADDRGHDVHGRPDRAGWSRRCCPSASAEGRPTTSWSRIEAARSRRSCS